MLFVLFTAYNFFSILVPYLLSRVAAPLPRRKMNVLRLVLIERLFVARLKDLKLELRFTSVLSFLSIFFFFVARVLFYSVMLRLPLFIALKVMGVTSLKWQMYVFKTGNFLPQKTLD